MKALIVYAALEGHTQKVAGFIADVLAAEGIDCDQRSADSVGGVEHEKYQLIILCAPIHVGQYPDSMRQYIVDSSGLLAASFTAFVSVSLGINSASEKDRAATRECVERFFTEINWQPNSVYHAAGAIQYKQYGLVKRILMTWISKREGGPTNTHQNHELTDWRTLAIYVKELATMIASTRQTEAKVSGAIA